MTLRDVVVVGASAAGLTAAETLRRDGFEGRLTVIGDEPHAPYDRPPLSKQVLRGEWERERVALRAQESLDALDVDWLLGTRAQRLDVGARTVELGDGTRVPFDGLVVATGVRPRRLPFGHDLDGVHVLRGVDDAWELREALQERPPVVVVGAGFLGAEAAAVARELGCAVTIVDPLDAPMVRQLGAGMADRVARLHIDRGVDLRCGTGVVGFTEDDGRVTGVRLGDGTGIPARVVVVAIGSVPEVDWLRDSGLPVGDGLLCDEYCEAAPGIVGAGDVASGIHPRFGRIRVEHRMNATEQGMAAARTLLGHRTPFAPIPYFWTDQYDSRIQVYGRISTDIEFTVVDGDPEVGPFAAVQFDARGRPRAVAAWNMPRTARTWRARLVDAASAPQPTPSTAGVGPSHITDAE
jgi:NADPH-dependent 2,4-dienoyl-CoA reductase/sulfur reductase-like enzyme